MRKPLVGMRVWHSFSEESDNLEPYIIYGYSSGYDGYYIRRPGRSLGRYRDWDSISPIGKP